MALTINTNIFSVNAQRNLQKSEHPLQTALQRLSTGYRINSAKDDAAGYAITARQTLQIGGLGVAIRNANDGVSFAQTAEGAMEEMVTALQRINELALQSASNNTATDRTSLHNEVSQLIAELNRIVGQTRYNGETFLDKQKSINIQVGTNVNEFINVSTANVSPTTTGVSTMYSSTYEGSDAALTVGTAAVMSALSGGLGAAATVEGVQIANNAAITTASDYQNNSVNILSRVNSYTSSTGVTAFNFGNALVATNAAVVATTAQSTTIVDSGYLTINGIAIGSFTLASGAGAVATDGAQVALANLASAINAKQTSTGVYAYLVHSTTGDAGRLVLANTSGAGIDVSLDTNVANASLITTHPFATGTTSVSANQNGKIVLNAALTKTSLAFNSASTAAALGVGSSAASVSLTARSVNSLNVSTVGGANVAILAVQSAIDTISSQKAKLGAVQNRLSTTISNLDNVRENATASRSRIRDADFAEESSNLSKALIIQQAGISVLSQANSITQNVLALLQ